MDKETLKQFCSYDNLRKEIMEPWTRGDYTYATNGKIIIRVPRISDIPENPAAPNVNRSIPWNAPVFTEASAPIPDLPKDQFLSCARCDGTGKNSECPECEGEGVVTWETKRHGYEADCEECDGFGRVAAGTKAEECNRCNGTGKIEQDIFVPVRGVSFNKKYLTLIKSLPEAILFPEPEVAGKFPPSRFAFNGGDGFVMPVKV